MRLLCPGAPSVEFQCLSYSGGPGQCPGLPLQRDLGPRAPGGQRRDRLGRPWSREPGQHLLRLLQGHRPQEERRPDAGGPDSGAPRRCEVWGLLVHSGLPLRRLPLLPLHPQVGALGPDLLWRPLQLFPLHRRYWLQVRGPGRRGHPHHFWALGSDVRLCRPGGLPLRLAIALRRSPGPEHRGHPAQQQHPGHGVGPAGWHRHLGHPHRPHLLLHPLQHPPLPALPDLLRPGHPLHHQHGPPLAHHAHGLLLGETVPEPKLPQDPPKDCQAQPPFGTLLCLWHPLGPTRSTPKALGHVGLWDHLCGPWDQTKRAEHFRRFALGHLCHILKQKVMLSHYLLLKRGLLGA